jgi:hypothetical protein
MSTSRVLTCLVLSIGAACSRSDRTADSANGGVVAQEIADTTRLLGATPAAGGAAHVTATDAKSVRLATEFRLTEANFRRFIQASDSLAVLRKRDPQARALLDEQPTDNGSVTRVTANDAGITHLESNAAVNNAIVASGMSVPDYFVASIAIAQAERFIGDPKAAPPTPTLGANAKFLAAHRAELDAMRARSTGVVTAAP